MNNAHTLSPTELHECTEAISMVRTSCIQSGINFDNKFLDIQLNLGTDCQIHELKRMFTIDS